MGLDERELMLARLYIADRLAAAAQARMIAEAYTHVRTRDRCAAEIGRVLVRAGQWLEAAGGGAAHRPALQMKGGGR